MYYFCLVMNIEGMHLVVTAIHWFKHQTSIGWPNREDQARVLDNNKRAKHPVLQAVRKNFDYEKYFTSETKQIARASYYGLCSFLDYQVG
jgi:hypothetical protein